MRLVLDTNTALMPITRTTSSETWLREAWENSISYRAYQAEADFLVTRDDDLLVLKDESEIPIVPPSELRVILHQQL